MGMGGQRSYNTPNPQNFNYPKIMHMKGNQYQNYPKFKEAKKEKANNEKTTELAKELEKQILELQKLTKEAKDLAKKKATQLSNNKSKNLNNNNNVKNMKIKEGINKMRRSNLDQLSLEPNQKKKFDQGIKDIIKKLDNVK